MTRNKDSYRFKGRAVFLAAIMVVSVLAMPIAFAGAGAAAPTPADDDFDRTAQDGDRLFQGQIVAINVSDSSFNQSSEVDLFTTTRNSDNNRILDSFVSIEDVETATNEEYVLLETEDLDAGTYALSDGSEGDEVDGDDVRFTVTEQTLDAEFDEDDVADSGADSTVDFEVDSPQRNNYAINVSADGLDDEDLLQIFNASGEFEDGQAMLDNRSAIGQEVQNDADNQYALMDDDEEVLTILQGEKEFELDFDDIDAGDYEFEVDVVDSTASASDTITVRDVGDENANFPDDSTTTQGDWAEITVEFENADNGVVAIGDLEEDGYQLNVTVDDAGDDDEVTLYFNTYAAGQFSGSVDESDNLVLLSEESDDADASINYSATEEHGDVNLGGDVLDTGSYEVAALAGTTSFEDIFNEADDITTMFVEERTDSSMNLWTASEENADDIEDLEDLVGAIEDSEVTETNTVADEDILIHEIGASGLSGLIGQSDDYDHDEVDVTDAFLEYIQEDRPRNLDNNTVENFSVILEQENPTSNRAAKRLNLSSSDTTDALSVLFDKESNTYYAVLDVSDAEFTRGAGGSAVDLSDEDEFSANINIKDARLLDEDVSDFSSARDYEDNVWDTASADFEFLDRDADFDLNEVDGEDYVTVEDAEDQEVTGETNIAPGSEITIRLRGTEGSSFVKSQSEVVVTSDRTFSAEFDFSDRSVGDEFNARLTSQGTLDEEDGLVVEGVDDLDEADDDDADDEADDHDDMDDDVDADDEDDTVEETEDDTPGFGALVAFLAVLGAAFLATRRQN